MLNGRRALELLEKLLKRGREGKLLVSALVGESSVCGWHQDGRRGKSGTIRALERLGEVLEDGGAGKASKLFVSLLEGGRAGGGWNQDGGVWGNRG